MLFILYAHEDVLWNDEHDTVSLGIYICDGYAMGRRRHSEIILEQTSKVRQPKMAISIMIINIHVE